MFFSGHVPSKLFLKQFFFGRGGGVKIFYKSDLKN